MKLIANKFRSNGFNFGLEKREGNVALFSKTKPEWTQVFYEVVILQQRPETSWPNGTTTPAHEAMPSSEQWGTCGWSYANREGAEARYRSALVSNKAQDGGLNQKTTIDTPAP